MKGFIALLLVMMTGMVFSQQSHSQALNSGGGTECNSQSNKMKRFLLVMSDDVIHDLKSNGQLSAPIETGDRDRIDHVVFHGSETNSERTDIQPLPITRAPSQDGSGRLEFVLSDAEIQAMHSRGLKYIIRDQDRGQYNQVVITYPSATAARQATTSGQTRQQNSIPSFLEADSHLNRNSTAEVNRRGQTNPANRTGRNDNFVQRSLGLGATNRNDRGSVQQTERNQTDRNNSLIQNRTQRTFGPLLPDDYDYDQRRDFSNQDRLADRRLTDQPARRDYDDAEFGDTRRNDSSEFVRRPARSATPEFDSGIRSSQNIREGRFQRPGEPRVADRRNPIDSRIDEVLLYESDLAGYRETDAQRRERERVESANRSLEYQSQQLAVENDRLKRLLNNDLSRRDDQLVSRVRTEGSSDREYERRLEELEDRYARSQRLRELEELEELDDRLRNSRRRVTDHPTRSIGIRDDDDLRDRVIIQGSQPRDQYTSTSIRNDAQQLEPRTNQGRLPAFSIQGPERMEQQASGYRPTETALWFILLFSLGLNAYLGMIARSFYVRYEELADEIRDTFTNSTTI